MDHPQTSGHFLGHRSENSRWADPVCDQGRHAPQRGLLLEKQACLAAALIGLYRPRPRQARDKVCRQRHKQKDDNGHLVLEDERHEMSSGPITEVVKGDCAGHRRRRRQPHAPHCRHH